MLISGKDNAPGRAATKKKKSDSSLKQHGGEGRGLPGKQSVNFTPSSNPGDGYTGPGRDLKIKGY